MLSTERLAPPPGALLVRVATTGPSWVGRLPPVPGGLEITVSVSAPDQREIPSDRLAASGYRIVGCHPNRTGTVDLLVPASVIAAHPDWWRQVLAVADRAFDLRLGPVQRILGAEISLHLRG
jgi:hypothetical protein